MDADYDIFEIVAVIRDFWLIDGESYQRRYYIKHDQPLAPGYYLANWPEHVQIRRFNQEAVFHRPFEFSKEAQKAIDWMHKERKFIFALLSSTKPVVTSNSAPTVEKADFGNMRLEKAIQT